MNDDVRGMYTLVTRAGVLCAERGELRRRRGHQLAIALVVEPVVLALLGGADLRRGGESSEESRFGCARR